MSEYLLMAMSWDSEQVMHMLSDLVAQWQNTYCTYTNGASFLCHCLNKNSNVVVKFNGLLIKNIVEWKIQIFTVGCGGVKAYTYSHTHYRHIANAKCAWIVGGN